MTKIIIYLLVFLLCLVTLFFVIISNQIPLMEHYKIFIFCIMAGGFGGSLYCLRGVYLNASVKKSWSPDWYPWYFIRPIVSLISGGASYIFLKAGLLILESQSKPDSTHIAFYALAFVAGLNVDKFINKIESIAQTTWGISKSRTAEDSNN
jgi:hypothetical protein